MNAPTPITFITLDGAERKFRLTNKRALAIRQRSLTGWRNGDLDFLWLTCDDTLEYSDDTGRFTDVQHDEDSFAELFPLHDAELLTGLVQAITTEWQGRTKSAPANDKFRPTQAVTQASNGSGLSPSGESTSAPLTSSGNSRREKLKL